MPKRSRYDELHDRYHTIRTTKAGTRYEVLAAFVFKALEERDAVIHDLSLMGDSEVAHQIDVSVEKNGIKRRVLLECKDDNLSGDKVGLGILRDFRSVLEDTKADEGIVVACNGFTKDAQKYAKAKGIKLVVLRAFEKRTWRTGLGLLSSTFTLSCQNPRRRLSVLPITMNAFWLGSAAGPELASALFRSLILYISCAATNALSSSTFLRRRCAPPWRPRTRARLILPPFHRMDGRYKSIKAV
jgi:hypothetical protein